MSNALPRHMYGDPMQAAMRAEAESCKGCEHERKEQTFSQVFMLCNKDKKHGKRCSRYISKGRENV